MTGYATSGSMAKNLIEGKGVKLDGVLLTNPFEIFPHPGVIQVGPRHFAKINIIDLPK